ncbi:MAG: Tyrosine-protein kinase (EC, partial [Candidatus Burkholderia crenata]
MLGDVSSLFDLKSTAAAESQILASRLVVTRAVEQFLRLPIFFGEFETEQDICKP